MRRQIISIDPGLHKVAFACWDHATGLLLEARLVEHKHEIATERGQKWKDIASTLHVFIPQRDTDWVIEVPQVYRDMKGKDPNDLVDLGGVLGAVVATGLFESHVVWSPLPREWKGQLPKEVTQKRVNAKLSNQEKTLIKWPIPSLCHNVYDAIHLGIVYMEREGLREFTK